MKSPSNKPGCVARCPLVTIAIPTYNRDRYLKEAIDSARNQTYKNVEILIRDNASEDTTELIGREEMRSDDRIQYVRNKKNIGMRNNWNKLLNAASGEYFLLLSDDDILAPNAIKKLLTLFDYHNVALAYGSSIYIDENGTRIAYIFKPAPCSESGSEFIYASLKRKRNALPCSTLHRTADARDLGGYPDVGTATDLLLRLHLATLGDVKYISDPIAKFRVHDASLSKSAYEQVIASHVALANSVSQPDNTLYRCRGVVRAYCARHLYNAARSNALRRRVAVAGVFAKGARSIRRSFRQEILVLLFHLPFMGLIAGLRRSIRNKLFSRRNNTLHKVKSSG